MCAITSGLCSEAQVLFTKTMEPVVAEEFGEATLEVEVSMECGEVQWMRQGVVIHPGPKFTLKQSGQKCSLTIRKLALSDRGMYSCETLHDRTQAKLSVERECARAAAFLTMQGCYLFTVVAGDAGPCCCCFLYTNSIN